MVVLVVVATPSNTLVGTNLVYVNAKQFTKLPCYVQINEHVFTAQAHANIEVGNIAVNKIQRIAAKVKASADVTLFELPSNVTIELSIISRGGDEDDVINGAQLVEHVKKTFANQVFMLNQQFVINFEGYYLQAKVVEMDLFDPSAAAQDDDNEDNNKKQDEFKLVENMGKLDVDSEVAILSNAKLNIVDLPLKKKKAVKIKKIDFMKLGIGGLDDQLNQMFRRAFASRTIAPELAKKMKMKHTKAVLLYGAPGCGKTLIARNIGEMLECKTIQVVNGPEVFSQWVGKAEEFIRKLFEPAEKDFAANGDNADLHLIIFDEMDAIAKSRGGGKAAGVYDNVVNQLLTKIDGVKQINNVLLIGMTNRLDMLDEAIVRSGRFEVKIEIGLPSEEGRKQILQIHTKALVDSKMLASDVNINELAKQTKNFSGADIEALVRAAQSFAVMEHIDKPKTKMQNQELIITMAHFENALGDVKPALGVAIDKIQPLVEDIIDYGSSYHQIINTVNSFVKQVKHSKQVHMQTVLLAGLPNTGKTTIAAQIANASGFPYANMVSADTFIGKMDTEKAAQLAKIFTDSYRSPLSVIILDSIERIIEVGPNFFSNAMYQTLMIYLKQKPPSKRKLLIIGTTSMPQKMEQLDIDAAFNAVIYTPALTKDEAKAVLVKKNVLPGQENELDKVVAQLPADIPIKKLLLAIDTARLRCEDELTTEVQPMTAKILIDSLKDNGLKIL